MNLKELRGRYDTLGKELETLTGKDGEWSDEDGTRARAVLDEMNEIEPKLKLAADARSAADRARTMTEEPVARHSGTRAAEGAETREARDTRTPVQRFLDSDEFTRFRQHPKGTSGSIGVEGFFGRSAPEFETRTLVTAAGLAGSMVLPEVLPDIYRLREPDIRMRSVLMNVNTSSDTVTVLQETSFTNAAAEVAEATSAADGQKPESALAFTEASFPVRVVAHWIPITRQALDDTPFLRTYLEQRLNDGLLRREDTQILNGNGTAPNLRGLLNTSGVLTLDATYFTANPVVNAGQSVENFNRILRAKVRIGLSTVGGASATFVVINPADYEKLLTVGDANRQYYGPGPFAGTTIPTMWGSLTVVSSEAIAAGIALVGDGRMAAVADRQSAVMYMTDSHSDFFIRNILVFLAEERIALPVFLPSAFAKVTLV
jgi:HK97 family phage major capsid protein